MLQRTAMARRSATPRCKHCRERFTPVRPTQEIHDECAEAFGEARRAKRLAKEEKERAKAARAERVQTRAELEKFKKLPKLIAEAQAAFNEVIRLRDKDKGCFVCGRPFDQNIPGRAIHAGHVRSRGTAGHLRFVEDNCMGECEGCNGPYGAKPHQIKAGAIARIGAQRFEELENDNTPHKWTRDEVREIRDTYRARARAMKKGTA